MADPLRTHDRAYLAGLRADACRNDHRATAGNDYFCKKFLYEESSCRCCYGLLVMSRRLIDAQVPFDDYFTAKTLRIDYLLGGNDQEEKVFLWQMKQEPNYGGPLSRLIDADSTGTYRYAVYDSAGGQMVFSKGFCTLVPGMARHTRGEEGPPGIPDVGGHTLPQKDHPLHHRPCRICYGKVQVSLFNVRQPRRLLYPEGTCNSLQDQKRSWTTVIPPNKVDIVFLAEGYTKTGDEKIQEGCQTDGGIYACP